mmetsp:Transcript_6521/g.10483  ORF Transcript_6521/g.10483 Transcript_6521/m.10483 type:complete len:91 (-) Transcript_6521:84-356(-)
MQQPGEAVSELARRQSVGSTFARVLARSKGMPVPFASSGVVQNSETGKGWTMWTKDYPFRFDGGIVSVFIPVFIPFAGVIFIARMLKKVK